MAPEVIRHEKTSPALMAKMDVWSYGVVVWELLTRQIPYNGLPPLSVAFGVGRGLLRVRCPAATPGPSCGRMRTHVP